LALILGAGVSKKFGVPDWGGLLRKLASRLGSESPDENLFTKLSAQFSAPTLARYIWTELKQDGLSNNKFIDYIKDAIYEDDFKPKIDSTFSKIVQLCSGTRNSPSIQTVITYNFDTLLEHFLDKAEPKIPYVSVPPNGSFPVSSGPLAIYHPHGTIPFDNSVSVSDNVVFDEREYHSQYIDHFNVANSVQFTTFCQYSCLFLGISLTDPNTRRLLDYSIKSKRPGKTNFIIRRLPSIIEEQKIQRSLEKSNKQSQETSIEEFRRVFERSVAIYEADAESLNIRTIWVKNHTDIPHLLSSLMPNS
jgi:hypothetical protein